MGLYVHIFYGGIVRHVDKDSISKLYNICKENGWNVSSDKDIFIINSNSAQIDIDTLRRFNSDCRVCSYNDEKGNPKIVEASKEIYDKLIESLADFDFDPRWIRNTFYSGNMTSSYDISQE